MCGDGLNWTDAGRRVCGSQQQQQQQEHSQDRMGGGGSKGRLPKEDMDFLIENTNFTKPQIKQWYKGFMVSVALSSGARASW